jgi:hypothetical protein
MSLDTGGWMLDGFRAQLFLWAWTLGILLHGLWRSARGPEPDPVRPSGPPRA